MESQRVGHEWETKLNWSYETNLPASRFTKESICQWRRCWRCRLNPWIRKIPWRRKWQHIPVFLPQKAHAQRNLEGYSPWSGKSWTRLTDSAHTQIYRQRWMLISCFSKQKKKVCQSLFLFLFLLEALQETKRFAFTLSHKLCHIAEIQLERKKKISRPLPLHYQLLSWSSNCNLILFWEGKENNCTILVHLRRRHFVHKMRLHKYLCLLSKSQSNNKIMVIDMHWPFWWHSDFPAELTVFFLYNDSLPLLPLFSFIFC